MQLYELVNKYHVGTTLSCAEAVFKACNEYYGLNLPENTRKMFSIMGIGMQTQLSCCGAFTVAVGIIGLITAQDGQEDSENFHGYSMVTELTDFVIEKFGTLQCATLHDMQIAGYENPCHLIVEEIAKKLETPATLLWKKLPKSWKNCLQKTSCTNILTTTCNKPGIQKSTTQHG